MKQDTKEVWFSTESEGAYHGKFYKSYASIMQLVTKKPYASYLYNRTSVIIIERERTCSSSFRVLD